MYITVCSLYMYEFVYCKCVLVLHVLHVVLVNVETVLLYAVLNCVTTVASPGSNTAQLSMYIHPLKMKYVYRIVNMCTYVYLYTCTPIHICTNTNIIEAYSLWISSMEFHYSHRNLLHQHFSS